MPRKTTAISAILSVLILLTPAFAESLVLGVSPAGQTVCASHSGSGLVKFLISTNVINVQNVTVAFEPNWIKGDKLVFVKGRQLDYNASIELPPGTPKGTYVIKTVMCMLPDPNATGSLNTASCVAPTVTVNVMDECPVPEENSVTTGNSNQQVEPQDAGQMLTVAFATAVTLVVIAATTLFFKRKRTKGPK